jgi:hypothetical protein
LKVCTRNYGPPKLRKSNFENFGIPNLWVSGQNDIWVQAPWLGTKNIIRGKVVAFTLSLNRGEFCESMFVRGSSVHRKCSKYALTNLLFGLYRFVWIIDLLVTHLNPYPGAPSHPSTLEMLWIKEHTPTPYPFVVFTFRLGIESTWRCVTNYIYACLFLHVKINFSLSLASSLAYIKLHKFFHLYFINRTCTCTSIMMVNLWQIKWKTMQIKNWIIMIRRGMHKMHTWINFVPLERREIIYMSEMMRKKVGATQNFVITLSVISFISIISLQVEGTNAQVMVEMFFPPLIKANNDCSNVVYSRRYLSYPSTISC